MTEQELIKKLEEYSEHPYFGAMSDDQMQATWSKVADKIGVNSEMDTQSYTWSDYAQYGVFLFRENMVRPLAVGFASMAVLLGGWTGMVGASFDSIPGDVLYPVKIANEKAQLSLAFSGERKVKLHAEFASRRLDEVVAINTSDHPEKDLQVKVAMDSFAKEVEAVNQRIDELKESDLEGAAELVMIMDRKVGEYEAVIEQTKDQFGQEMAVVEDAVDSADDQVLDVLVENQEANQEPQASEDLQQKFQQEYAEINQRVNLSVGRIASIEMTLDQADFESVQDYSVMIDQAETELNLIKPALHDAMNVLAAGGFRSAFDMTSDIFSRLEVVENALTETELEIISQINAPVVSGVEDVEDVEEVEDISGEVTD
jgi:hypothetical protein